MVSGESPFLSPLLPCESAPVWHRRQFQSSQRCGVSITPLAGRSKILLSSLASTFGGASITTWAEVNVIIAHHCVVLNIEEEEPVDVSAGTRQWHPADLEIIPTVFRWPFVPPL